MAQRTKPPNAGAKFAHRDKRKTEGLRSGNRLGEPARPGGGFSVPMRKAVCRGGHGGGKLFGKTAKETIQRGLAKAIEKSMSNGAKEGVTKFWRVVVQNVSKGKRAGIG